MTTKKINQLFINKDEEAPILHIRNIFDELAYLSLYRAYIDMANTKELTPLICLTTQDEGGNERKVFLDTLQLDLLIDNLSNMRYFIQTFCNDSKEQSDQLTPSPFRGGNVLEQIDNLFMDFNVDDYELEKERARKAFCKYEQKCKLKKAYNDSRRKKASAKPHH